MHVEKLNKQKNETIWKNQIVASVVILYYIYIIYQKQSIYTINFYTPSLFVSKFKTHSVNAIMFINIYVNSLPFEYIMECERNNQKLEIFPYTENYFSVFQQPT